MASNRSNNASAFNSSSSFLPIIDDATTSPSPVHKLSRGENTANHNDAPTSPSGARASSISRQRVDLTAKKKNSNDNNNNNDDEDDDDNNNNNRQPQKSAADTATTAATSDLVTIHRNAVNVFFGKNPQFHHHHDNNNHHTPAGHHHHQQQQQQQQKLAQLQQKLRILCALVGEAKIRLQHLSMSTTTTTTTTTVQDELRARQRRTEMWKERPYLQVWKKKNKNKNNRNNSSSSNNKRSRDDDYYTSTTADDSTDTTVHQAVAERDLAARMRQIRQFKKIAAAYRLGGISMLACPDEEVLALRFDVEVEGSFIGCYHCFFDLVIYYEDDETMENDNENGQQKQQKNEQAMLHLRLIQHTLPPSVPLASILEKTMGGVACIGPYSNENQWKTNALKERLQNCAKEIYQACYCYSVRKHTATILKSFATTTTKEQNDSTKSCGNNKNDQDVSFTIQELKCSDRLDKLSFKLALVSGISTLQVILAYKDPMRAQPTHVTVKNLAESSALLLSGRARNSFYAPEMMISDDDDDDNDNDDNDDRDGSVRDDLTENATVSFRRLSIRKALQEVSEAMAEW